MVLHVLFIKKYQVRIKIRQIHILFRVTNTLVAEFEGSALVVPKPATGQVTNTGNKIQTQKPTIEHIKKPVSSFHFLSFRSGHSSTGFPTKIL